MVRASSSWFPGRYGINSFCSPFRLRVTTLNGFGPIYTFCELAQFLLMPGHFALEGDLALTHFSRGSRSKYETRRVETPSHFMVNIVILKNANSSSGTGLHYRQRTARRRHDCPSELHPRSQAAAKTAQVERSGFPSRVVSAACGQKVGFPRRSAGKITEVNRWPAMIASH